MLSCQGIREDPVSIEDMLEARDRRAERQHLALAQFALPVISMTLVMPGPEKNHGLARFVAGEGLRAVDDLLRSRGWPIVHRDELAARTGPEALYAVEADAMALKRATAELEDGHPLGRVWDLDVIDPGQGAISRSILNASPRKCLVCEQPGHACSRSRRHPVGELRTAIREMVDAYRTRS